MSWASAGRSLRQCNFRRLCQEVQLASQLSQSLGLIKTTITKITIVSNTSKNSEKWKLPDKYVFIMNISNFNLQIEAYFFQSSIAKDWIFIYSCGIWSFWTVFLGMVKTRVLLQPAAIFFFLLVGQEDWKLCYSGRRETFYETFSSSRWT